MKIYGPFVNKVAVAPTAAVTTTTVHLLSLLQPLLVGAAYNRKCIWCGSSKESSAQQPSVGRMFRHFSLELHTFERQEYLNGRVSPYM